MSTRTFENIFQRTIYWADKCRPSRDGESLLLKQRDGGTWMVGWHSAGKFYVRHSDGSVSSIDVVEWAQLNE